MFQNNNFIVVDKPAGWLTTPSRMGAEDARPCLGIELEKKTKQRIWPVHRLDQEVSGVVLFALNSESHKEANHWFEDKSLQKTYEAWSEGSAPAKNFSAVWKSKLLRGKKRAYKSTHGKSSETHVRFMEPVHFEGCAYLKWELQPHTGRPHQLRFELFDHGFPILGDQLYGATKVFRKNEIALRAVSLDFKGLQAALDLGLPEKIDVDGLK